MLFNSYLFIFAFLPVALLGFYYLGQTRPKWTLPWLIVASLFFYGWWNPNYLFLILLSILVNFQLSRLLMTRAINQKPVKWCLGLGVAFNLGLIAYFKYANFIVDNINYFSNSHFVLQTIILPLAISFFTFQQIAYLVDCAKGQVKYHSFTDYCFFITFFPQLIAGPIVHHYEILPQVKAQKPIHFNHQFFSVGCTLFMMGLFKKVIIADHLSAYATPVFDAASTGTPLTFFEAWGGALAYTFQLYFDFSGYSDMALGLAKMFGFRLPMNFFSPYKATNIIEFWRRWHMTLSRFLKEYLYIPLGGNRQGEFRRSLNLMLTMLIGGLWHGAGWTFVVWGGLHGLYLMINHRWQSMTQHWTVRQHSWYQLATLLLTFFAVVIAWVVFRANDLQSAVHLIQTMLGMNGISLPQTLQSFSFLQISPLMQIFQFDGLFANNLCHWPKGFAWIVLAMITAWGLPNTIQVMKKFKPAVNFELSNAPSSTLVWYPTSKWLILTAFIALVAILHLGQMSEFLYFQF